MHLYNPKHPTIVGVRLLVALVILLPLLTGMASVDEALFEAAKQGNVKKAQALLKKGADVNAKDTNDGKNPLHWAAANGHKPVVEILLSHGAKVNAFDVYATSLHLAADKGHEAVVEVLLKHGAELNAQNDFPGGTPIHYAAHKGQTAIVDILLKHGADPNVGASIEGRTPLHAAALRGHSAVVEKLLAGGARVNAVDRNGATPLVDAAFAGDRVIVEQLLTGGAEVNSDNRNQSTALDTAADQGHVEVVKQLIKAGAKVNAAGYGQSTPLHAAVMKGHTDVVELLLASKSRVNHGDEFGITPLHWAASWGHAAVAAKLLANGADISIRDKYGAVPLHYAVDGGHLELVGMLLDHDAYVGVKDDKGQTPLDRARTKGRASVVQLLEQAAIQQQASAKGPISSSSIPRPALRRSDVDNPFSGKTRPRTNSYALVVGIEGYRNNLPKADYAAQDAKIMGEYLTNVMGYQAQNVTVLLNERAAKADIEKYVEHWLPNRVEADAAVFVYFSGHGAPNPRTGEAYVVPFDGDPAFMEATGYPLTRLYEQLNKLPAKEIIVVLDSCFSGAGGRSVIAKGLRPIVTEVENPLLAKGKTIVLAASAGPQVSSTYEEKAHGLLTYFFLKGLQGEGDTNNDGTIELAELFHYLKPQVERVARRDFNNEQTPQLLGSAGVLERGVRLAERARP